MESYANMNVTISQSRSCSRPDNEGSTMCWKYHVSCLDNSGLWQPTTIYKVPLLGKKMEVADAVEKTPHWEFGNE